MKQQFLGRAIPQNITGRLKKTTINPLNVAVAFQKHTYLLLRILKWAQQFYYIFI